MKHICFISFILVFFAGCASHTPAPVINRSPQASSASQAESPRSDWRPDTYIVKKGDTLYSIGLEHGYDYKEIAAANNIYAPYTIGIGQKLNFASLNSKESTDGAPSAYENQDGVIVTPIDTEEGPQAIAKAPTETTAKPTTTPDIETATEPATPPALAEPKAVREPYSEEAFNRKTPKPLTEFVPATPPTKVAESKATEATKPVQAEPTKTTPAKAKSTVVSGVAWSWPTKGKVSSRFNGASNKGVNIAGKKGQSITAASKGKVIYTGADLRGYGKLVIIKHSKTLLSVYAHNSKINVKEGQMVKAGQKIAEMGNTDTDSMKLHFEIRQKGKSVDPEKFLPKS